MKVAGNGAGGVSNDGDFGGGGGDAGFASALSGIAGSVKGSKLDSLQAQAGMVMDGHKIAVAEKALQVYA